MELVKLTGSTGLIVLGDDIETGLLQMRDLADRHLGNGCANLLVDISAVQPLSPSLLSSLLLAHRACLRRGGRLSLRGSSQASRGMLARTGLRPLFIGCDLLGTGS